MANDKSSMTMSPWASAGIGVGMGLVNNVSNLLFGDALQKQQLRGYQKSLELQNAAALDLWNKTNYGAQMEHLKAAGLNPGLLYGMGGGGGATTGGGGGMPAGRQASPGMDIAGAAQLAMMQAQTENIKADTNLKNQEAQKKGGVDTQLGLQQIETLKQQVKSDQAKQALTELQTRIGKFEETYQGDTLENRIAATNETTSIIYQQLRKIQAEADIAQSTKETVIAQVKANLATTALEQEYIRQQTKESKSRVEVNYATIQEKMHAIEQRWREIVVGMGNQYSQERGQNIAAERLLHDKLIDDVAESTKMNVEIVKGIVQAFIIKGGLQQGRTEVRGFKR